MVSHFTPRRSRTSWVAYLALTGAQAVLAHDTGESSIPEANGLRIDAAAAVSYLHSSQSAPAPRLTGVLGLGDTPADRRGWELEHGTLGLGARFAPQLGAAVAVGWHGRDRAHVESAWVEARASEASDLTLGGGRSRMPLGPVIGNAGHFDRYAQTPLAKRALFNGDWIEDGLNAAWRPHLEGAWEWLQAVDVGLWRARTFPGSENARWAPTLHVRAAWADWAIDGFYSRLRPEGRGAYVQRSNTGHIHTAPQCNASLRDITCFDGTVDLAGASATWETPIQGVTLSGAGLLRRVRGSLYSQNGDTAYKGKALGGWIEAVWQPSAQWDFGVRQEWLRNTNSVNGPGAALVAADASLLPNDPSRRFSAMAGWRPFAGWLFTLEAARERVAGKGSTVLALRALWTPGPLLERNW